MDDLVRTLDALAQAGGVHPDLEWAASGAMALTGRRDGPPLLAPAPLASRARCAVAGIAAIAGEAKLDATGLEQLDAGALLGERAACSGFARNGATSAGGSCELLRCSDGWIAVNLARADDVALLPAWLGSPPGAHPLKYSVSPPITGTDFT